MRFLILSFVILFISLGFQTSLIAQNPADGQISGTLFDAEANPAPFAAVVLHLASDSSMVKGEISSGDGSFIFEKLKAQSYFISVQFLGHEKFVSELIDLSSQSKSDLGTITLNTSSINLNEYEVKAERALIEVQADKTVFNVDGSINATGSTALELLRKSPGVVVDNNNNIILSGKNGVQIYIDGKPSPLSTSDLATQLSAMQSSEIDAIEIITNPSAKYDAEGNAGIINIRMKKDKNLGANASLNLGYSYGKHHKYNASTTFNYRNKKANIFGSYSFNDGTNENWINLYRIQNNVLFDAGSITRNFGDKHGFKFGTDFFLNDKNTIGFLVSGFANDSDWTNYSQTPITDLDAGELTSILEAESINNGAKTNGNINLNYSFRNDKSTTWNFDLDYGAFNNREASYQPNTYYGPDGISPLDERNFRSTAPTTIDIYSAKVDYETKAWGGTLGTGLKSSFVRTDNDYEFYSVFENSEELDTERSNNFVFDENVNAAYLSFTRPIKKFNLSLGLRMEQTNSKGVLTAIQGTENDEVPRNYVDFFPSTGLSYQFNRMNQFKVNYSRRIDRPSYQDLNPFEFKISELSYRKGNPFLQPQYTNSVSLSHTYKYTLTTSVSYSYTKDFFANISDSTEVIRSFLESINLDYQQVISVNVSYPTSLTKWWSTYTNIGAFRTHNYADLGDGRKVDIKAHSLNIYHQSTFSLPWDLKFELSGWYGSPSIWGAVYATEANFSIDTGLSKSLFNNKGKLKIAFTDIFNSANWRGEQEFAGFYVDATGGWESQQIRVNFSYLFGNDQVKKTRNRQIGLDDEIKRAK